MANSTFDTGGTAFPSGTGHQEVVIDTSQGVGFLGGNSSFEIRGYATNPTTRDIYVLRSPTLQGAATFTGTTIYRLQKDAITGYYYRTGILQTGIATGASDIVGALFFHDDKIWMPHQQSGGPWRVLRYDLDLTNPVIYTFSGGTPGGYRVWFSDGTNVYAGSTPNTFRVYSISGTVFTDQVADWSPTGGTFFSNSERTFAYYENGKLYGCSTDQGRISVYDTSGSPINAATFSTQNEVFLRGINGNTYYTPTQNSPTAETLSGLIPLTSNTFYEAVPNLIEDMTRQGGSQAQYWRAAKLVINLYPISRPS